ncbi:hypothetical protein PR048_015263 [Dryococelus australis]|uniref:Uncharacterized protein n=1 Tax=Dryococelus australis TaxID=614101 RepID=A0ABQ9HGR3_9NEOP|nr:hypothetical protein PR048_015263 [Dryococelus australis]
MVYVTPLDTRDELITLETLVHVRRNMLQRCTACVADDSRHSHQVEPGSIPGGVTPDFRMWESCWMVPLAGGFSRGSPVRFPVPSILILLHTSSRFTLISSQDLDVKRHSNIFTRSLTVSLARVPNTSAALRWTRGNVSRLIAFSSASRPSIQFSHATDMSDRQLAGGVPNIPQHQRISPLNSVYCLQSRSQVSILQLGDSPEFITLPKRREKSQLLRLSKRLEGHGGVVVKLLASHQGNRVRFPAVPGCRWSADFLGDLPFLSPCILSLLHTHLVSPSPALRTSVLRAAQLSSLFSHSRTVPNLFMLSEAGSRRRLTTAGHTHLHVFLVHCPDDKSRRSQCCTGLHRALSNIFGLVYWPVEGVIGVIAITLVASFKVFLDGGRESEILTEMDLPTLRWTLPPIEVQGFNLLTTRMARYLSAVRLPILPPPLTTEDDCASSEADTYAFHVCLHGASGCSPLPIHQQWSSAGKKGREKREILEKKTPADQRNSPLRFPLAKIRREPGLHWWEASSLTAHPPRLDGISDRPYQLVPCVWFPTAVHPTLQVAQKKKSNGERSRERGGHGTGSPLPSRILCIQEFSHIPAEEWTSTILLQRHATTYC